MKPPVDIGPETKIAALLEAYPALEPVLIAQSPAFENLKNPVLRRTVARVASIEQAARMAGIAPGELVRALRAAAGSDDERNAPETNPQGASEGNDGEDENGKGKGDSRNNRGEDAPEKTKRVPDWVGAHALRETLDADALLRAGETPLGAILRHAAALEPGTLLKIVAGFRPVPLIESLEKKAYRVYTLETEFGKFEVFVAPGGKQ